MANYQPKSLLALALRAGEIMLKNGAETYRVEDIIDRLIKAGNIKEVSSFVIPTGIFVSLTDTDGKVITRVLRINERTINLDKIAAINDFTRNFTETPCDLVESFNRLNQIDQEKLKYGRFIRIIGAGIISSSSAILFGGPLANFAPAFITGSLVQLGSQLLMKRKLPLFFRDAFGGALAALSSLLITHLGFGLNPGNIILGTIMPLVPGVAITNALRDAMHGDLIASTGRAMEAFLSALAIAAGVALVLSFWY
ncbi:MAG TPA: threonine/serine exporter family protein [Clostridia bacterium]|nr:threonine/serine exporter family protein [Clostridia bacterium]